MTYQPGIGGPLARPFTYPSGNAAPEAGAGSLAAQATETVHGSAVLEGAPAGTPYFAPGVAGPVTRPLDLAPSPGTLTPGGGTLTASGGVPVAASAHAAGTGTLSAAGTTARGLTFVIAAAVGDNAAAPPVLAPSGWQRLYTVTASNGTDSASDCALAAACTTTASAVSVTATAAVHEDMSGVVTGVLIGAPSPVPAGLNPGWPCLVFEAAFGSGYMTPPDQMTWVNIQSLANGKRLRKWEESTGIQHELDGLEASELDLLLDNPDGALSPFNPSGPWYPDVVPGTPVRIRAVPPAATGVNAWAVISRNVENWPQSWDPNKRGQADSGGTDIWSVIARKLPSCYRAEVLASGAGWWWPCDDPAVIPTPVSLVNAAPGSSTRLQIASSPNGLSTTISGYPFASGFSYSAVQAFAASSGWMYGDSVSASWEQSGTGSVTTGRYLIASDPSFPPLSGGCTIAGWWKLPYKDTGGDAQRTTGPYTQPSGAITLWQISSGSAPLARLGLDASGDLVLTTYSGTTATSATIVSADLRNTTWTGVTVTLTQSSWQCWVNGGVTAYASGTASMSSAWQWFMAGASTGTSGGAPTAGNITGLGNIAHSSLEIYPRVLPAARVMAHYMAAYTAFGQMPAPALTAQFVQNDGAAGGTSTYGPDGKVYSGNSFAPPAPGETSNTMAALACMTGGGYTSAPSVPESVTVVPTGATVSGFMWLTTASPACPAVAWYTGSGAGSEKLAAATETAYLYADSYGTGAAPPAAPSALGDTVQNRLERLLAAGKVTTPARCIDPAPAPVVAELDTAGQACGQAVTNIVQSDGGLMFVDSANQVCYWEKPHLAAQPVAWTLGEDAASGLIPYEPDAAFDTDPQQARNDIEITQYNASPDVSAGSGGLSSGSAEAASGLTFAPDGTFYAQIQASIEQNGPQEYAITSYLQSTGSIQAQCDWVWENFGSPRQRVTSMTVNAAGMTRTAPSAWLFVLGANIGDVIQATRTPPGQPSFSGTWRITHLKRVIDFSAGTASAEVTADYYTSDYWS